MSGFPVRVFLSLLVVALLLAIVAAFSLVTSQSAQSVSNRELIVYGER